MRSITNQSESGSTVYMKLFVKDSDYSNRADCSYQISYFRVSQCIYNEAISEGIFLSTSFVLYTINFCWLL